MNSPVKCTKITAYFPFIKHEENFTLPLNFRYEELVQIITKELDIDNEERIFLSLVDRSGWSSFIKSHANELDYDGVTVSDIKNNSYITLRLQSEFFSGRMPIHHLIFQLKQRLCPRGNEQLEKQLEKMLMSTSSKVASSSIAYCGYRNFPLCNFNLNKLSTNVDGNEYYRLVYFTLFEQIILEKKQYLFENLYDLFRTFGKRSNMKSNMEKQNQFSDDESDADSDTDSDDFMEFLQSLKLASEGVIWRTVNELEFDMLNEEHSHCLDYSCIAAIRNVTSRYIIHEAPTAHEPLLESSGCVDIATYCSTRVEEMGVEADETVVNLGLVLLSLSCTGYMLFVEKNSQEMRYDIGGVELGLRLKHQQNATDDIIIMGHLCMLRSLSYSKKKYGSKYNYCSLYPYNMLPSIKAEEIINQANAIRNGSVKVTKEQYELYSKLLEVKTMSKKDARALALQYNNVGDALLYYTQNGNTVPSSAVNTDSEESISRTPIKQNASSCIFVTPIGKTLNATGTPNLDEVVVEDTWKTSEGTKIMSVAVVEKPTDNPDIHQFVGETNSVNISTGKVPSIVLNSRTAGFDTTSNKSSPTVALPKSILKMSNSAQKMTPLSSAEAGRDLTVTPTDESNVHAPTQLYRENSPVMVTDVPPQCKKLIELGYSEDNVLEALNVGQCTTYNDALQYLIRLSRHMDRSHVMALKTGAVKDNNVSVTAVDNRAGWTHTSDENSAIGDSHTKKRTTFQDENMKSKPTESEPGRIQRVRNSNAPSSNASGSAISSDKKRKAVKKQVSIMVPIPPADDTGSVSSYSSKAEYNRNNTVVLSEPQTLIYKHIRKHKPNISRSQCVSIAQTFETVEEYVAYVNQSEPPTTPTNIADSKVQVPNGITIANAGNEVSDLDSVGSAGNRKNKSPSITSSMSNQNRSKVKASLASLAVKPASDVQSTLSNKTSSNNTYVPTVNRAPSSASPKIKLTPVQQAVYRKIRYNNPQLQNRECAEIAMHFETMEEFDHYSETTFGYKYSDVPKR